MYSKKLIEIFNQSKNAGIIKNATIVDELTYEKTGEIIKLFLNIENNVITEAKFKAYGNPVLIASTSVLTQLIKGNSLNFALELTALNIINELGDVPENRKYCAQFAIETLNYIIGLYKEQLTDNQE